jgi:anti-sigma B factor antagonist
MNISDKKIGMVCILNVSGRIDSTSSQEFEKKISKYICQGEKNILLDFSNLEYISSAGLRVLLVSAKNLKAVNGKFMICCIKGMVKEVFLMSGFIDILTIFKNEEEALNNV